MPKRFSNKAEPSDTVPAQTEAVQVNQGAYNAIMATYKVMRHATLGLFTQEGLTESQFLALYLLAENGPMLMRKMSEALFVTPANITGIVDRLEEKRLVRRSPSREDRRVTIIEPTQEGEIVAQRVAKRKNEMIRKALVTFTREEQMVLNNLLERFQREMSSSTGKS